MDIKMNSNLITDIKVTRFRPQALPLPSFSMIHLAHKAHCHAILKYSEG